MRHVLVDGGRPGTYATLRPGLKALSEAGETLELLVLTHIDNDHVQGLLQFVSDPDPPIRVEGVWFNPTGIATDLEVLGFDEAGDFERRMREVGWPLNAGFADGTVAVDGKDAMVMNLAGGLRLTILSPERGALDRLRTAGNGWSRRRRRGRAVGDAANDLEVLGRKTAHGPPDVASLLAVPEVADRDPANGASIAFLAEWRGRRVLLAADAHPGVLTRSLRQLATGNGPVRVDVFKVSHHGAKGNTSVDLLQAVNCTTYAFSTDGSGNGHPDPETVARIVSIERTTTTRLLFNYHSHNADIWDEPTLKSQLRYECTFATEPGILAVQLDDESLDDGPATNGSDA